MEGDSATLLSGFRDTFRAIRVVWGAEDSISMEATASVPVEGGQWLGPIYAGGRPAVVSVGNNVRLWDLGRLIERAKDAIEREVGQIYDDGEPLFWLSAPASGKFFAGLSRYGNLRVWSDDGRCVALKQVVASLKDSTARDFDYVQMIDFAGQCLYVTVGQSGAIQSWHLDGKPAYPRIQTGYFIKALYVHVAGQRLVAFVVMEKGQKYQVAAWDLVRSEELTVAGRFEIEDYKDKTIDHLAVVEDNERTIIIGALGHSYYHKIYAWDLNSAPVNPVGRKLFRRPARKMLWQHTVTQNQITCMAAVRYLGLQAVAFGDDAGWITVLQASDGQLLGTYQAHESKVTGVNCTNAGGKDVLVSAGFDGTLVGVPSSLGVDPSVSLFTIDVGDRINAIAAVAGGRLVAGTEQGFLLFNLLAEYNRRTHDV